MRETPPYSLAEIRLLLSQYLDGVMEADQMLALDAMLEQFPTYQAEFLKLQATRELIQQSLEKQAEAAMPDLSGAIWQSISSQLKDDRQASPEVYPPEWISAYLDGEMPGDDPQRQSFERQLAKNPQANQLLSELELVSETVRQFGYRLENACTLNITAQVMASFQAEQAKDGASMSLNEKQSLDDSVDTEWELLSAFVDQALSPRETIEATRLIEASEAARTRLSVINQLSEGIQGVSQQLQNQAPDLWIPVRDRLQAVSSKDTVRQLSQARRLRWAKQAAVPIAAAVLLIVLSLPNLHWMQPAPSITATLPTPVVAKTAAKAQPAQNQELASLPASTTPIPPAEFVIPPDSAGLVPVVNEVSPPETRQNASASAELKPMLEPAPAALTVADASSTSSDSAPAAARSDEVVGHKAPSSESYLFDALNRQMPEEEISSIIGK